MRVLELFCGRGQFSKEFRDHGHDVINLDIEARFNPTICKSIFDFDVKTDLPKSWRPHIIWASPPCQGFSVAALWHNWDHGKPISDKARLSIAMVDKTIEIIKELKPKYFFIENPRGMLRTLPNMRNFRRCEITYCTYGLPYQKPTDIWTNCGSWIPRKPCKANDRCHEPSPRGSKSGGIQSVNGAEARSILPAALCFEIREAVSKSPAQSLDPWIRSN